MSSKASKRYIPTHKKTPRVFEDVDALESKNFAWKVHMNYIDITHDVWGWGNLGFREFVRTIVHRLNNFETMTWQEITNRKSCHPMPIKNICSKAQSRINELHGDIDTLHQVDVSELGRVWGFRDRLTFYLIWYDPDHTVCPLG
jgi:hypothetical protein